MKKNNKGVTLLELLIAILVMSILASVAGPSFMQSFERQRLIDVTEQLYSNLQLARSESISRSAEIHFKFNFPSPTDWRYGFSTEENCFPNQESNTASRPCYLFIDNGDGVEVPADDYVMFRHVGRDHDDISMSQQNIVSGVSGYITFSPINGVPNLHGAFIVKNKLGDEVIISLNPVGTVKICSDDFSEYRSCS